MLLFLVGDTRRWNSYPCSGISFIEFFSVFFRSVLICLLKLLYFIYIVMLISETYSEPCETSKVEFFAKIVNGLESLTIFVKNSILGIWQGSEYGSRSIVPVTGKLPPSTPFLTLNINQAITLTRRQLSLGVLGNRTIPPGQLHPRQGGNCPWGSCPGEGERVSRMELSYHYFPRGHLCGYSSEYSSWYYSRCFSDYWCIKSIDWIL